MSNIDSQSNTNVTEKRKEDPQVIVTGMLKEGGRSDVIVFTIPLSLFEIVCIVTVPEDGTKVAPVYLKFRVKQA